MIARLAVTNGYFVPMALLVMKDGKLLPGMSFNRTILCCISSTCPAGYTCLRGIGQNPNDGLSHFDNAAFALSLMFQTFTLDSWNDVYQMVETYLSLNRNTFNLILLIEGVRYEWSLEYDIFCIGGFCGRFLLSESHFSSDGRGI